MHRHAISYDTECTSVAICLIRAFASRRRALRFVPICDSLRVATRKTNHDFRREINTGSGAVCDPAPASKASPTCDPAVGTYKPTAPPQHPAEAATMATALEGLLWNAQLVLTELLGMTQQQGQQLQLLQQRIVDEMRVLTTKLQALSPIVPGMTGGPGMHTQSCSSPSPPLQVEVLFLQHRQQLQRQQLQHQQQLQLLIQQQQLQAQQLQHQQELQYSSTTVKDHFGMELHTLPRTVSNPSYHYQPYQTSHPMTENLGMYTATPLAPQQYQIPQHHGTGETQFCTPFSLTPEMANGRRVTGVLSTLPPKTETPKATSAGPQPAYYPVRRKWGPGCRPQQPGEEPVGRATPPPVGRLGPAGRVSPPVGRLGVFRNLTATRKKRWGSSAKVDGSLSSPPPGGGIASSQGLSERIASSPPPGGGITSSQGTGAKRTGIEAFSSPPSPGGGITSGQPRRSITGRLRDREDRNRTSVSPEPWRGYRK